MERTSSTYEYHRPIRLNINIVHSGVLLLLPRQSCANNSEEVLISCTLAHGISERHLVRIEEADLDDVSHANKCMRNATYFDLPVCRETQAITTAAEMVGHARDKPKCSRESWYLPGSCCFIWFLEISRRTRVFLADTGNEF